MVAQLAALGGKRLTRDSENLLLGRRLPAKGFESLAGSPL